MMDFVDVFVKWTPMKRSMSPVVKGVLHDEKQRNLPYHCVYVWERNVDLKTKIIHNGMENVNLRKFDSEVLKQDVLGTSPLISRTWDLGLDIDQKTEQGVKDTSCNFHRRKNGIVSIMIHGKERPK